MKILVPGLLVLALLPWHSALVAAQNTDGDKSREELEQELLEAEREVARLERQLRDSEQWLDPASAFGESRRFLPMTLSADRLTLFSGRARLGFTVRMDADAATERGALVESVVPEGPAAQAGVEQGDLVTHWNGEPLKTAGGGQSNGPRSAAASHLLDLARGLDDGDEVELTIERGGETKTLEVTARTVDPQHLIGSLADSRAALDRARDLASQGDRWQGGAHFHSLALPWRAGLWSDLEVTSLNEGLGRYFGTDRGLLVLAVPEEELFGLEAGDVILAIGDREPRDMTHAMRILNSYEAGETINLQVMRSGSRITLSAQMPERRASLFPLLSAPQI